MRRAASVAETKELEGRAMRRLGVDVDELMERVGAAVADAVVRTAPIGRVVVLAGKGDNAGDGWVAARLLHERGREVLLHSVPDPGALSGAAATARDRAVGSGTPVSTGASADYTAGALRGAALVVDALFGSGLTGAPRGPYPDVIAELNGSGLDVLAVDLPSGVEGDTGAVHGEAVRADRTLAVLTLKRGHVLYPGAAYSGDVSVASLGLSDELEPDGEIALEGGLELWDAEEYASLLEPPAPDAHKGSRGRVVVVGGSGGMAGSVCMAAEAALRSGAGYVVAAVPASIADVVNLTVTPVVARSMPETDARALSERAIEEVTRLAEGADAVILGPGLTTGEGAAAVARALVRTRVPLLVDADGLNVFADDPEALLGREAPTVITPHPGEAARLLGVSVADVQADRVSAADRLAERVVCVLKGAGSVVSGHGRRVVDRTGDPGMATLGTGDVLSGVIGALLAQSLDPLEAAALGAYVHGIAGEEAAGMYGSRSMIATDVVEALAAAFATLSVSVPRGSM